MGRTVVVGQPTLPDDTVTSFAPIIYINRLVEIDADYTHSLSGDVKSESSDKKMRDVIMMEVLEPSSS